MNEEIKFKLQAHLDGELSDREGRELSELLSQNRGAQMLLAELNFTKTALCGNEVELKLPETREFYWGKIQREIERSGAMEPQISSAFQWWKPRWVAGIASACALLMVSFIAFRDTANYGELEGANGDMGAITYHSDSERMTVVYLFDREAQEVVDSN